MEPKISLQTLTVTLNGERTELRDSILTTELVESLGEQEGASILAFSVQTEGEIPEEGLEVTINSDITLTDYFANLGREPFTIGGEVTEAVYDETTGEATGLRFRVFNANALVSLTLESKEEVETDGTEQATFSLEAGDGYSIDVDNSSSTVVFNDSLDSLPVVDPVDPLPVVSMSVSDTQLIESEGNTNAFTFNVEGEIPADGLLVYVNSTSGNRGDLGEFDVPNIKIDGGTATFINFSASGFYLKIFEDGASITVSAFDETTNPEIESGAVEGIEDITFKLEASPDYVVNPDAGEVTFSFADDLDSQLQVSYTVEPTVLVESEETIGVHNFSLSTAPPEGGLTVSIKATRLEDFNLDEVEIVGGEITEVTNRGFEFNITEMDASISLPILDDTAEEFLEEAVFTLESGEGYQIDPEANGGTFTLVNIPEQVPPATTEVSEPNDTIELAQALNLGDVYSQVSIAGEIDYNNSNRYDIGEERLYVDFTEDVDFYSFNLEAGDTITLDTDARQTNLENPSELDTVLRLFDVEGNQLAQSDDDGAPGEAFVASTDSYLEFTAETEGTYYVGVSSFPNGEFDFFDPGENNPYEPTEPASGTGRSTGTYTLNASVNTDLTPDATEITPGNGEGVTVGLQSIVATLNGESGELQDTILAPNLVEFLGEQEGSSILTLAFNIDGEVPAAGLELVINSDVNLTEYFGGLGGSPFSFGGEVIGAVYNDDGDPTGLRFLANQSNGFINLNLEGVEEAETDGAEDITFTLEPSTGYVVSEESPGFTATIYDSLADVPAPTSEPTVGINASVTELIESEATEMTFSFDITGDIPEDGVLIYANIDQRGALGEFNVFDTEISGGVFPTTNFAASGFYFRAFQDGASITFDALDESTNPQIDPEDALEGIEEFTISVVESPGYTLANNSAVTYTIADNPDSVVIPEEPEEPEPETPTVDTSEGNDTIADAIITGLNIDNPTLTLNGEIDSDRATRNLVDASEDVDMYSFNLNVGDTITIDVDSIPYEIEGIEATQRVDSELRLFDAAGNELLLATGAPAPDEIFTANRDAYLEYTAEENGTYYVGVAQLGNRTYDPNEAGTGSGRIFPDFGINIGEYDIEFKLDANVNPPKPDLSPIFGTLDMDTIEVEGSNQIVFAGDMNDLIDAFTGTGGNRVYAGSGDDTLILGASDRISAGEGNDKIFVTFGGDNTITGGAGEDQFWIANAELPDAANIITDFTSGEDVIGIAGLGIGFADLTITQIESDALIASSGTDLAVLQGIDATSLSIDNFAFA